MVKKEKDKFTDSGKTVFRISASQALRVAEMQIEKCRRLKEWRDAYAVRVFPLYSRLDKEEPSYFEVKISTPSDDDAGTVIISATDRDFPIIGFRTRGRTLSEKAISKSGHKAKRIIWHGSDAVTGEDEAGKEIVSLGRKPTLVFDLEEYEEFRRKRKEDPLPKPLPEPKKSEELQEEWKEVKKALGLIQSNPDGVAADSFDSAWGWSRHANLDQYDLPGYVDKPVGCAATAWSALLVYHDMYWDPDLLYGTHDNMSEYIKRSMRLFHDAMGTDDDGNTRVWRMRDAYSVFKDFHCFGNLSFNLDHYHWWDPTVFAYFEPKKAIQDFILFMISSDTPVIVGLVTSGGISIERLYGHYCLGLAWGKNDKGKLKWVLCDELHGDGWDDFMWWHRRSIFGAWGIPRGAYDHPRWKTETDVWSKIELSNLDNEIYAVGIKSPSQEPPLFLIRRGPATEFPIPVRGTNAKSLEFDESIEVPVYELQGSEVYPGDPSITTWKKERKIMDYLKETSLLPANFKAKDIGFTRLDVGNLLLKPKIQVADHPLFRRSIYASYLFLAWPDVNERIHIAYAIIPENLEDMTFKHVLLPERFVHKILPHCRQTPIAIAQHANKKTGPMLYIAYTDANTYIESFGTGLGRLVIIDLNLFFQIEETGEDLWPQDTVPNLTYEDIEARECVLSVLTDFKWHWPRLAYFTRNLRLSSNGKEVALLWGSGSWSGGSGLRIHWSYTFETKDPSTAIYPHESVYFGDCHLEIAYAKYGYRFLHNIWYKKYEGDYCIGDVEAIYGDVLYASDSNTLVIWIDHDQRLLIAKVSHRVDPRRADLLADLFTSGYNPKLAFVKDELDNKNIVLTFSKAGGLHSRIFFLSGPRVSGITDFDDLPK